MVRPLVGVTEVDFGTHRDGNVEYGLDAASRHRA